MLFQKIYFKRHVTTTKKKSCAVGVSDIPAEPGVLATETKQGNLETCSENKVW